VTTANGDVFEQVADMIVEEDFISGPKTPAFLEIMRLQFTETEARLALHIRTTGGTLTQLVERTKIKKDKLEKMLYTMADKGTVYYDSGPDPVFKIVRMAGPGWVETGIWGGIKHAKSVRIAKAINQVMKDWTIEKMCKIGFPYTIVWPGAGTLPADADPAYNLAEATRNAGAWSVSLCPCRLSHWITEPGDHCEHMLETCIQTGDLSRWTVKHGMARALSYEEFAALLEKCNQDGLVLTGGFHNTICNCCNDCCTLFYGQNQGHQVLIPAPFLAQVDEESCNGCNNCVPPCPVSAITAGQDGEVYVSVSAEKCIGCGVCVSACTAGFMHLVSHTRPQADEDRARMQAIAAQLEAQSTGV
jgi:ferredoxin